MAMAKAKRTKLEAAGFKMKHLFSWAVVGLLAAGGALAADESVFFFDDFEKAVPRDGAPTLVSGITSPGLLVMTGMGVYRGEQVTVLDRNEDWTNPDKGKVRFSYGFRLYSFGETRRVSARLVTRFADGDLSTAFEIRHVASEKDLVCRLDARELRVPYDALPADVAYLFNESGEVELKVTSLSDSQVRSVTEKIDFFAKWRRKFAVKTVLASDEPGVPAELKLDNLQAALAFPERKLGDVPAKIVPCESFDPVKAGWPLVFADDFDGAALDEKKWVSRKSPDCVHVKDGNLVIDCRLNADGKTLRTGSIHSHHAQTYGYFESRLKFTTENGWWAAFWLYSRSCVNPFLDGFEIDIFEDYYTRRRDERGRPKNIIDHNLHLYLNATLKSWNYMETLKGSIDDYHVIGCKWTPFEISYYMDGRLIESSAAHSPWNSVTFDAFNHATGVSPLWVVLSGQIMDPNASWLKGATDFKPEDLPYHYSVDWVRVYAYPDPPEEKPTVRWRAAYPSGAYNPVKAGATLDYAVEVKPAAKTGAAIRAVHLFDNGYLLASRTAAPYEFSISCTKEFFEKTAYLRPGRQKQVPRFDGTHVLIAFAEDVEGRVARSEPLQFYLLVNEGASTPFRGQAAKVPGVINATWFDEGGSGVAYSDNTRGNRFGAAANWRMNEDVDCTPNSVGSVSHGEWLNYTVDVAAAGEYEFVFRYGTPEPGTHRLTLLCDLRPVATLDLPPQEYALGWSLKSEARAKLRLPAGRHVLRLVLDGNFNFATLDFNRCP